MQETQKISRSYILVILAISSLLLMVGAKIWQSIAKITLLPIILQVNDILLAIAITTSIIAFSAALYRFWPLYRQSMDVYIEDAIESLEWWDLIWLGLLPGLSEELLFRGVILQAFGADILAVIFSSLIFGILHLRGFKYWPYAIIATLVSLVLGWSALFTGNLLVPITIHILVNFFSCLLWKYYKAKNI